MIARFDNGFDLRVKIPEAVFCFTWLKFACVKFSKIIYFDSEQTQASIDETAGNCEAVLALK